MGKLGVTARLAPLVLLLGVLAEPGAQARAAAVPSAELTAKVRGAVEGVMATTHVPSAQVGIVQNGKITYVEAFGLARLSPPQPATTQMHYAIGSISKQFTVAAVMLLQEQGKLSIDDPISKWFPELTRAKEVTLRNLMSHTSGYSDYAPQDYTIPEWTVATSADKIVHQWATKPLDFDPGTQYQYSNTNFNIVGLIVQKVAGEPFWSFLKSHVLQPVGLPNAIDLDTQHAQLEPTGYFQHGLSPPRPAVVEAAGWYFADGEMAMPVSDLLTWDISVMNETLLSRASYAAMEAPTHLKNGLYSNYGLGLEIGAMNGHRSLEHSGEVGGFVAQNTVLPDDKVAVVVLTNQEASDAASSINKAILDLLIPGAAAEISSPQQTAAAEQLVQKILVGLQNGRIDRSRFTPNANFYFDKAAIEDYASSLRPLGAISAVKQSRAELRGGMRHLLFKVEFANGRKVDINSYWTSDGKVEQYLVGPES
jgi:D-alanyl-D-alanine carboxypeptidase